MFQFYSIYAKWTKPIRQTAVPHKCKFRKVTQRLIERDPLS